MQGLDAGSQAEASEAGVNSLPRLFHARIVSTTTCRASTSSGRAAKPDPCSLASLERQVSAAEAMNEVLKIEPGLTLALLRQRVLFMPESIWGRYAAGLRTAGLPD